MTSHEVRALAAALARTDVTPADVGRARVTTRAGTWFATPGPGHG